MRREAILLAVTLGCACSGSSPPARRDAAPAAPADAAAVPVIAELPLGLATADAFAWRTRPGHAAFRIARKAEARSDWPAVSQACKDALAADPTHLEAAWLLAASLGWQGKLVELVEPLARAVAGDYMRWGPASLQLPALAAFLATPTGEAWRARVTADRERFLAAIATTALVNARGDLYAVDAATQRWYRLTRTNGLVVGGLAAPDARKIAYVTRFADKPKHPDYAVGVIDFGRLRTTRPLPLQTAGSISLFHGTKSAKQPAGFYIASGASPQTWRRLDEDTKLVTLAAKAAHPSGAHLEVTKRVAHLVLLPIRGATADWDEQGLASALRLAPSNRVVSVPSPGLIDGTTARWSATRTHLAFVARLDETCTPGTPSTAAVVADAATGKVTELVRATNGIALEWIGDRELAISADSGVAIYPLDGGAPRPIAGAEALLESTQRATCVPDAVEPEPDAPDPTDDAVSPPDAAVVEPIPPVKSPPG